MASSGFAEVRALASILMPANVRHRVDARDGALSLVINARHRHFSHQSRLRDHMTSDMSHVVCAYSRRHQGILFFFILFFTTVFF